MLGHNGSLWEGNGVKWLALETDYLGEIVRFQCRAAHKRSGNPRLTYPFTCLSFLCDWKRPDRFDLPSPVFAGGVSILAPECNGAR